MALAPRMTAEEFLALPRAEPPLRWAELIDGEIVVDAPKVPHQLIVRNCLVALDVWTETPPGFGCALFNIDVPVDEHSVVLPDVMWFASGIPTEGDEVPELVIEVRSESTWHYDRGKKRLKYELARARELWLVDDVAQEVTMFRRSEPAAPLFDIELIVRDRDALTSPQLPGFVLSLDRLFGDRR